jgi:hypothetical protein
MFKIIKAEVIKNIVNLLCRIIPWKVIMSIGLPTSFLTYLVHITEPIKYYAPFSYGIIFFIGIIIGLIILNLTKKKENIENKLIVLDSATKIDLFSKDDKDYCVVKLHIFNCSDQIIQVTPDKKSTWVMINEKSKNPLDNYYFPELFLPYYYNDAIQTPPIEVDLSGESKSIEIVLSVILNYSIYNSDTKKSYELNYQYNKTYDILPKSSLLEKALNE